MGFNRRKLEDQRREGSGEPSLLLPHGAWLRNNNN
jgi:hypothetical protein